MSEWQSKFPPNRIRGLRGWLAEADRHFYDGKYSVLVRTVRTDWGDVEHACCMAVDGKEITWREKQRIKNELFGRERVAIEVFPSESELVDGPNRYHIWVMPKGMRLPFGLRKSESPAKATA